MKLFTLLFASAVIASAAPVIKVDNADFDFGTVAAGPGELKHTYKITNTGNETLKIEKVKPGCSCTIVEFDPELKPGETSDIVAALSMKDRTGKQNKSIDIISNAENAPIMRLSLQAYIMGPVNMDRKYGIFTLPKNGVIKDNITLLSGKKDLKIVSAWYVQRSGESESKKIPVKAVIVPTSGKPVGNAKEFQLQFNFKRVIKESEAGTIYFKTNHPDMPILEFRCMIEKK